MVSIIKNTKYLNLYFSLYSEMEFVVCIASDDIYQYSLYQIDPIQLDQTTFIFRDQYVYINLSLANSECAYK